MVLNFHILVIVLLWELIFNKESKVISVKYKSFTRKFVPTAQSLQLMKKGIDVYEKKIQILP